MEKMEHAFPKQIAREKVEPRLEIVPQAMEFVVHVRKFPNFSAIQFGSRRFENIVNFSKETIP